jgi:hypothetical protein
VTLKKLGCAQMRTSVELVLIPLIGLSGGN